VLELWQDFNSISIDHCNRGINRLAYNLASLAIQLIFFCICMDEPPSFSIEALMYDKKIIDQNLIFLE
jgi:hypothetical protein